MVRAHVALLLPTPILDRWALSFTGLSLLFVLLPFYTLLHIHRHRMNTNEVQTGFVRFHYNIEKQKQGQGPCPDRSSSSRGYKKQTSNQIRTMAADSPSSPLFALHAP